MLEGVEELKETVRNYMTENDLNRVRIGGYDVFSENGQIMLEKLPEVDVSQLHLPLYDIQYDENERFGTC
ncbi:unnamed protein product [marine sediment metagenome]|uniref:Uncharacterized protein n=1 Tax=marine sediment metagenome TaxID=412755 RepID=X1NS90_9ZZZZ